MILLQELLKEILAKVLETEKANVVFQNLTFNINELVENKCFVALQKIKTILEDDSFSDKECLCKLKKLYAS